MQKTMKVQQENITVAKAKQWLAMNTHNRSVRKRHVAALARDIANGRWLVNGDAIRFGTDGVLLDGQHRLHAVVKAGKPIQSLVVRDLDAAVLPSIDGAIQRSGADVVHLEGEANANALASGARLLLLWLRGDFYNNPPSKLEILEVIKEYPSLRDAAAEGLRTRRILSTSVGTLMNFLFSQVDAEDASLFFDSVREGDGLRKGDAILALRERLYADRGKRGSNVRRYQMAYVIKAWEYYRGSKPLKHLRFQVTETFPKISHLPEHLWLGSRSKDIR